MQTSRMITQQCYAEKRTKLRYVNRQCCQGIFTLFKLATFPFSMGNFTSLLQYIPLHECLTHRVSCSFAYAQEIRFSKNQGQKRAVVIWHSRTAVTPSLRITRFTTNLSQFGARLKLSLPWVPPRLLTQRF